MPWLQLRLYTAPGNSEHIEDAMLAAGAAAVTYEDGGDQALFEPAIGTTPLWSDTRVTGLFSADIDVDAARSQLTAELGELPENCFEILEDKDWERTWMDNYHPMQFGERLWICPSWCEAPQPEAVNLMLDPGLAFGTGTHPTTALCLGWLDSTDVAGKTVVDYGCGSGILAIAALLLGASKAHGVDIDPQALTASRDNALRNDITEDRFVLSLNEGTEVAVSDIVIANILAGPLIELGELLASLCKPGGQLALSGIIDSQAEGVRLHYSQWFDMEEPRFQDEWTILTGTRKPC